MMEHIFRNINDIRIFDIMTEFVSNDDKIGETDSVDINEIMKMLEYNEYKRIEVEDSVEHLVRQKILGIKKIEVEGITGCKLCKYFDKMKIPRIGEHKRHIPEEIQEGFVDNYYMKDNNLTQSLISAVFANVFLVEGVEEKIKIEEELKGNTIKEEGGQIS